MSAATAIYSLSLISLPWRPVRYVPDAALSGGDLLAAMFLWSGQEAEQSLIDTHDGADERKRERFLRERDEEIRLQRERLRADLLAAVERATHKPPPLDASLKQLAGMAKRAPGFDYPEAVAQIDEIQSQLLALQRLRESASIERAAESERAEQKRRKRRAEEELIIVTFLSS